MDITQAELVEKYQHGKLDGRSEDEDDLLELLDDDDAMLAQYREQRIQQLSKEFKNINKAQDDEGFGQVVQLEDEKSLMEAVAHADVAIVHFHQPQFAKCKVMAARLDVLAQKHLTVKVFGMLAESAPFLVSKLQIKVLPCVIMYSKGKEVERLVGFEKLGNTADSFEYKALEDYLYRHRLINRKTVDFNANIKAALHDSDSDLDL